MHFKPLACPSFTEDSQTLVYNIFYFVEDIYLQTIQHLNKLQAALKEWGHHATIIEMTEAKKIPDWFYKWNEVKNWFPVLCAQPEVTGSQVLVVTEYCIRIGHVLAPSGAGLNQLDFKPLPNLSIGMLLDAVHIWNLI
ncbi:hypothetical protein CISG_03681 [Coccidioides immitis RMSCC 3703]|uniref:Uncharacterized protein n=1 Tax=Coccidioides immitis RMSCC 3703 TaxID=454286 RepID=A0A0J8QMF8_COCIT|nr:hypothetical protein CISG_03681 [Coccidioides immitis RMSCC 3703]